MVIFESCDVSDDLVGLSGCSGAGSPGSGGGGPIAASLAEVAAQSSVGIRSSSENVKAAALGSSTCAAGDQLAERVKCLRF